MSKEFFIPNSVPSSKNSKVWTGKFLVWSKAACRYRKDTQKHWLINKIEFRKEVIKAVSANQWPIRVSFKFIRGSKHKFDYVNPLQTVLDIMVEQGWISDDNADVIIPVFEPYEYNKKSPGVVIKIL
jgi:hypothetical protein